LPVEISSIPCALFAYETDLVPASGMQGELERLNSAVRRRNRTESAAIRVPLSALTVVSHGHIECIDASKHPADCRW